MWAKQILHNDGKKEWKTEFRLRFEGMENGKIKASYIAGINLFEMTGVVSGENLELAQTVSAED